MEIYRENVQICTEITSVIKNDYDACFNYTHNWQSLDIFIRSLEREFNDNPYKKIDEIFLLKLAQTLICLQERRIPNDTKFFIKYNGNK